MGGPCSTASKGPTAASAGWVSMEGQGQDPAHHPQNGAGSTRNEIVAPTFGAGTKEPACGTGTKEPA
jgi:hypothetical protein